LEFPASAVLADRRKRVGYSMSFSTVQRLERTFSAIFSKG